MSRSSRFFHTALDFLHHMHNRIKHVVKPITKAKNRPKANRRLSSDSRNTSATDLEQQQPQDNDRKNPIKKLVCQNCEAAKIAQSVALGRKIDVSCKTAVGTCVVGGLITPPKLDRESKKKWVPKVTKRRKAKVKEEAAAAIQSQNTNQTTAAVAIQVQPPSPQKGTLATGSGGCCGGGCGCGSSQVSAVPPTISTPTAKPEVTAAAALSTPGDKGALLAIATRTPRKRTLKALSTPVKTPRKTLASPAMRRRIATPRQSPRIRRVAQAGRAGRTATMVGLGSLMGARAFTGGSVAFLGLSLSATGVQVVSNVESINSPRLLLAADQTEGPSTPGRSLWHARPRTPYHNHIANVKIRNQSVTKLSVTPLKTSHYQLMSSGQKTPTMRAPITDVISPIPYVTAHTPAKVTAHGVVSSLEGRFTRSPQISFRSTPLGTRGQPASGMSLSSAIRAAGITAGPTLEPDDYEDVFEQSADFTAVTAIGANYGKEVLYRKYV